MTRWTNLDGIGRTSVELNDRDVIIIGPGLIYTTKHNGSEYSIKSRFFKFFLFMILKKINV